MVWIQITYQLKTTMQKPHISKASPLLYCTPKLNLRFVTHRAQVEVTQHQLKCNKNNTTSHKPNTVRPMNNTSGVSLRINASQKNRPKMAGVTFSDAVGQGCTTFSLLPAALRLHLWITAAS